MTQTTERPPMAAFTTPLRHVREMSSIAGKVREIADCRFDVVVPDRFLGMSDDGYNFTLSLPEAVPLDSGVLGPELSARYTRTAFVDVANKLHIPVKYLEYLSYAEDLVLNGLAATNVVTLAGRQTGASMFRFLQTSEGLLLRAVKSDRYQTIDCDTALTAIVKGLAQHDLNLQDAEVDCDWSSDRLRLRLWLPQVGVAARELMRGYRSPWDSRPGSKLPMLFAGVEITNSDTGHGAFAVAPRAVFQVCTNGMTRRVEFRQVHVGGQLDQGVVEWSEQTYTLALQMLTSQIEDAVGTFLHTDYLDRLVKEMLAAKGVDMPSPTESVRVVQQRFKFSDAETNAVLDCLMRSGDTTVFGLAQAITAAAQGVNTSDRQNEMEVVYSDIVARPESFAVSA